MNKIGTATPNDKMEYEVTDNDLPLLCPMPSMSLWNSHPRVFLSVKKPGKTKCPYCGTEYIFNQEQ
ncbi:zinc-finger domain-containing protein [Candidatus Marithioploca araucensis]|uniref:Zinc-finger domain-containing protein n=1 Tax=Candidatus Marithioploca araucensis TaxID=70273 RepID=A0ABT7VT09_9GAMM|nr:zinc-finger domain-containing protein [Candidatus Marithioploca araucensis]